jgi:FMN reductase
LDLTVVVGNPKPDSRTFLIATELGERLADLYGAQAITSIDLALHADELFVWPSPKMAELNDVVAASDIVVVASPTYKATYTGMLKAFLDRYPNNGLSGVTAIPLMTAGSPMHAMAPEIGLRPLLVELGASVPTQSFFMLMSQMDELADVLDRWVSTHLSTPGIIGPSLREREQ